ncbi:MAG: Rrf2 family transcriptional regulator [Proteobacteria bacterium]|nr:Rrf2 family transcriptional regulator [Pseudomonadota bacterium]MCL2308453.1 Rrf2 family transcriptional regulator [Pseudomonadota bacterium]
MRLNTFTDYAIRTLIYLALVKDTNLVTRREIAAAHDISDNHLMKVVHFLSRNGYIETARGKGGGMRLAHAPEKINIGKLIRNCESDIPIVVCFKSDRRAGKSCCKLDGICALKGFLSDAHTAMYKSLERHTLADLLVKKTALQKRLGLK